MAYVNNNRKKIILPVVVYTVLVLASGGAGLAYSKIMLPAPLPMNERVEPVEPDVRAGQGNGHAPGDPGSESADLETQLAKDLYWADLATITTNIGDPENVWVRLDLSLASTKVIPELALAQISEDVLLYFRTVKLVHANSPSGFRHMMGDIKDIANLRAEGMIFDVYPRAVVFE